MTSTHGALQETMAGIANAGPLRLNLGGRTHKIPGFLTVDLYDGDGVDVSADVAQLPFESNSVSEIYASHILEHFSHTRTVPVLSEWQRVLIPGGKLSVSVPDFDAMVTLYKMYGLTSFIRNMLYGDQGYALAYHYTAFNAGSLLKACHDAGFSSVKRIMEMPYGLSDCSSNVDTANQRPISVHVEAIK